MTTSETFTTAPLAVYTYQKWNTERAGNMVFSPLSLGSALSMTASGARGNTAAQFDQVFGRKAGSERDAFYRAAGAALGGIRAEGQLNIANKLFGQQGFGFEPAYLQLVEQAFASGLEPVDFARDPMAAASRINAWVSEQTRGKIPEIVGGLDSDTRLVLANAVYMKANWASAFLSRHTRQEPFHMSETASKPVPMMHKEEQMRLAQLSTQLGADQSGAKVLELFYAGGNLSMRIILPESTEDAAVDAWVTEANLNALKAAEFNSTKVRLSLPKFKIEMSAPKSLKAHYQSIFPDAFDARADFSGIVVPGGEALFISDVLHRAMIEVDETGTEAAAATAVVMARMSAAVEPDDEPVLFTVDRPFLFVITHTESNEVVFMGKVTDPSVTSSL